jgi:hypothetical protein
MKWATASGGPGAITAHRAPRIDGHRAWISRAVVSAMRWSASDHGEKTGSAVVPLECRLQIHLPVSG